MPVDRGVEPADVFRIRGCYAELIAHQRKAIISIDLRLLNWSLDDPAAAAADRGAVEAEARANPRRSVLLAKLEAGEPVIVNRAMLHVPADPPEWLLDSRINVRVRADDLVQPSHGPPDQHAQQMG